MADNYLITGYWGEPHVTSENDRGINAAMFGTGRFVLPVGERFRAEYIGNNTIRMYDGKLMDNGAAAGIPAGQYVDFQIANAGQGMKRIDLIVFRYEQDASTLIESGKFVVIQGEETSDGNPQLPTVTQQNLLSGNATFDEMPMWWVLASGAAISNPARVFSIGRSMPEYLPLSGGTMTGAIEFPPVNNTGFMANGLRFGAFKFDANTTCRVYIGDFNKWSMLVSITENKGSMSLYHVGGSSPTDLRSVKISGVELATFAIEGNYLVITVTTNWSTGWYISNGAYTDMTKE